MELPKIGEVWTKKVCTNPRHLWERDGETDVVNHEVTEDWVVNDRHGAAFGCCFVKVANDVDSN